MKAIALAATAAALLFSANIMSAETADKTIPGDRNVFREIDSTINRAGSRAEKSEAALRLFSFFTNSSIMGDENYAVYIARKYFLDGKLETDEENMLRIKMYDRLNGNSLIGMEMPELTLLDQNNEKVDVKRNRARYKLIYFYDTGCPQCKLQSPMLLRIYRELRTSGLDIYAVYTGTNSEDFLWYIENVFESAGIEENGNEGGKRWFNLYDPEYESSFYENFNVLSTPQLFIIDEFGFVAGRNLDAISAVEILDGMNSADSALENYINGIFEAAPPRTYSQACYFADKFYGQCDGDSDTQRRVITCIFRMFKSSDNYELLKAAIYIGEKYILGKPELWTSETLDEMSRSIGIFNRNPLDSTITDITVYDINNSPVSLLETIRKSCKTNVIMFYTYGCPICIAAREDLRMLEIEHPDAEFIYIYAGTEYDKWLGRTFREESNSFQDCENISGMHESFDLSSMPAIYVTDENGKILAKDISTITLKKILEDYDNR